MNEEGLDQLIQRVLEGTATTEERSRLDATLATDANARRQHAEMSEVFRVLKAARLEEAPGSLGEDVRRAVRQSPEAARRARRPAATAPGLFPRFLLPFAAGAAACSLVWIALTVSPESLTRSDNAVGTMGAEAAGVPLLSLGSAEGRVVVLAHRGEKGSTVLEVRSSGAPARVWVASNDQMVTLAADSGADAPKPLGDPLAGLVGAELGARGTLRVTCSTLGDPSEVRVTARLADGSVSEGAIRLEWLPWFKKKK